MSQRPYDDLSHLEGALRRAYQARKSLSHIDAGLVEADEFTAIGKAIEEIRVIEESFEQRIEKQRLEGEWQWPMRGESDKDEVGLEVIPAD